jgi:membrane peptidoglycan carboxypeptidase
MTTHALHELGRRSVARFQRIPFAVQSLLRDQHPAASLDTRGRRSRAHLIELAHRRMRWLAFAAVLLVAFLVGLFAEYRTSFIQSHVLPMLASRLTWTLGPGASTEIQFPRGGPFDVARGYVEIPIYRHRLAKSGFELEQQARFSKELSAFTAAGMSPPAPERAVAGLVIRDRTGAVLYDATAHRHRFHDYDDIPPVVVRSLLAMEDQHLTRPEGELSPAVDWARLMRASVFSAVHHLGLPVTFQGGSTLAVQMEKYRHSQSGRTSGVGDKVAQIAAASLRVYRDGPDVREKSRQIILDYLNSVPLGGAPGYGEVHGLGEGLRAWFGRDPDAAFEVLRRGDDAEKARVLKDVLALLCSVRAPARMLGRDHAELERRVAFYEKRLEAQGLLESPLATGVEAAPIRFDRRPPAAAIAFDERRPADATRVELLRLLGVKSLSDLDQLDLQVETSYDARLQQSSIGFFHQLEDSAYVRSTALEGERLLGGGDPAAVRYTLLLYERGPDGDVVRVRSDNLNQPFDLNSGMRMELGSTAKLRTMAHYLEIIEKLHGELSSKDAAQLAEMGRSAPDPLTQWAAGELAATPDMPLDTLLAHALERVYSASPYEVFWTGGGEHVFGNYEPEENSRHETVNEAFEHSTNLVFVRLMRDIVRWHEAHLDYDVASVLDDPTNPRRLKMLAASSDAESRTYLRRAWNTLHGASAEDMLQRVAGSHAAARRLAILYFAWNHGASPDSLAGWLGSRGVTLVPGEAERLAKAFGDPALGWRDYAYLLGRHPLEIWCGAELHHHPQESWAEVVERSKPVRDECQAWLLRPGQERAQRMRLRIAIEQDAFAQMTKDWRRLGFPFAHLVPSLATAIGSSADRPDALADLIGTIANDGVKRPATYIRSIRIGAGTPYETVFVPAHLPEQRLLSVDIARAMRPALLGVVTSGTARRVDGAFHDSTGSAVAVGGKTGSGDNRVDAVGSGGRRLHSRSISRTAAFAFFVGDRLYGVLTASVVGDDVSKYHFTSALTVEVLKRMAPDISAFMAGDSLLAQHLAMRAAAADSAAHPAAAARDDERPASETDSAVVAGPGARMAPDSDDARGDSSRHGAAEADAGRPTVHERMLAARRPRRS